MALGPRKRRPAISLGALDALDPRMRLRLAVAAGGVLVAVATLATCGACAGGGGKRAASASADAGPEARVEDAAALRASALWEAAKEGEEEDLATLAAHEGAIGLVEAASEPSLRGAAIRAMAYARGWSQLPFLSDLALGKDDEEARIALEAAVELAARVRVAEEPEDAAELRRGCEGLLVLARDAGRPKARRVAAIRALRMMPCPPAGEAGIPDDLDAK